MAIRLEIKSEIATSREPAKVLVYENENLVAKIIAEVELKQGADGGWYHCVTIKKVLQQTYSCLLCGTTTSIPHVCPVFYPELRS